MSSCLTTTTTCYPCSQNSETSCECPHGTVDAACVQYTGEDLDNIGATSGMFLDDILALLDSFTFSETAFTANSTDAIAGTSGGTNGHSPSYDLILDPDPDNIAAVTSMGLMVDLNNVGDGKVKVDSSDPKDYLEDQVAPGTDGIITITPTTIAGVVYMVPSIDIEALLNYIKLHYKELLCSLVQDCIHTIGTCTGYSVMNTTGSSSTYSYVDCDGNPVGPITLNSGETSNIFCALENSVSTSLAILVAADYVCPPSTTTTTTAAPTTTTTTTTTVAPNDFTIVNNSANTAPFPIYFTDSVSLIDYVVDSTTGPGQTASYSYSGTSNSSKITIIAPTTIQPSPPNPWVEVKVNGSVVHNALFTLSSLILTVSGITSQSDVVVTFSETTAGTTSTTTTTTTP